MIRKSIVIEATNGIATLHTYGENNSTVILHISIREGINAGKALGVWLNKEELKELSAALSEFSK